MRFSQPTDFGLTDVQGDQATLLRGREESIDLTCSSEAPQCDASSRPAPTNMDHTNGPSVPDLDSIGSIREAEEVVAATNISADYHGSTIDRIRLHHQSDTNDVRPPSNNHWDYRTSALLRLPQSLGTRVYSLFDIKLTVRFVVVIFSHLLGIAATFSVTIAANRPGDALPSIDDDSFPITVVQVAASLLSPLLFGVISTRDTSTSVRQKIVSFYYLLFVVSVLLSFVSLLLYAI
ncbi:hypothetical protein GGR54DRAFT_570575 [Hypoxylon sp. NC1633]|nr:hypothetical protein GGR54DRAFT_570575 [Hypoxylon sp. NC1633]